MAIAIEKEITTLQLEEKKLVAEIKRTAKIGNELSISPRGRIAGKTTEDANRMKRKRETFNAPCTMDEALRVRASSLLLHTMDRVSSLYVSRMKQKRKTFKAPCTMDEALRMQASPSLPRTMDGASSLYVLRMKRKKKTFKASCTMDEA
ncbi:vacuolar protein sorting-associated protein 2 homolog 2-like [Camellia sinensis]|uniref:vacuolar protein sorting-associated protein 2 homolog 2-like n=1 Tax=Camellia sinensis TaxID=4442 RepID=UPI001035FCEA|nr:vacuolar protein sorting-associated protein 2 homolog 2-like [Camellia sinensis]